MLSANFFIVYYKIESKSLLRSRDLAKAFVFLLVLRVSYRIFKDELIIWKFVYLILFLIAVIKHFNKLLVFPLFAETLASC